MSYLVKTKLENNKSKTNIYLGTWCFSKPCFENLDSYNIHNYVWESKSKLYRHAKIIENASSDYFKKFCEALNFIHNENLTEKYWGVLTNKWFTDYLSAFYVRYLTVKEFITNNNNPDYKLLDVSEFDTPNGVDFGVNIESDKFNEQLYSQILNNSYVKLLKFNSKNKYAPIPVFSGKCKKISVGNLYCDPNDIFKICENLIENVKVDNLRWESNEYQTNEFNSVRMVFDEISKQFNSEFEIIFFKSLIINTPKLFIEGLPVVRKFLSKNHELPLLTITNNDHIGNYLSKLAMAESTRIDGKLIFGQHGPNYGAYNLHLPHMHEFKYSDIYYTWGWSRNNDSKLKNMPSLTGSYFYTENYNSTNNGVLLFIGSSASKHLWVMDAAPKSTDFIDYGKMQKRFLTSLRKDIVEDMIYRPYFDDYDQGLVENILSTITDRNIINAGNATELFNHARIVVIDRLDSSSVGNVLNRNQPCIIYSDRNNYSFKPEHSGVFEMLNMSGILHYTALSAAEYINEIYDNVTQWWYSDQVQESRAKYINTFAKPDKNYINIWTEELNREFKYLNNN